MDTILQLQGSISAASELTPLWLIHPISGLALPYLALDALSQDCQRPVYGINSPIYAKAPFIEPGTLQDLALAYVRIIKDFQPQGPYLLGGWSMGGMIAMSMASILENLHERIIHVVLIDSINPNTLPPFETKAEQASLAALTYNRLVDSSKPLLRPGLHRFDSSSSVGSDIEPFVNEKAQTYVSVTEIASPTSSWSSRSASEVDLSYLMEEYKRGSVVADSMPDDNYVDEGYFVPVVESKKLSHTDMLDRMSQHVFHGLGLIAEQSEGCNSGFITAPVTLFKCSILDPLPQSMPEYRQKVVNANFEDNRCGWRTPRLQTILLKSAHDRVFDSEHVAELTLALRSLLRDCA